MKNLIKSFNDFVNESYMMTAESSTSEGGSKIIPIGDTGISLVTFPEGTSFSAKDNKPYILLLSGVQFTSFLNNETTTTVELSPDDMDLKDSAVKMRVLSGGKKFSGSDETTSAKTTLIYNTTSERNPDVEASINILNGIMIALYGSYGVKKENVSKLIKAMSIMKDEQKDRLAKNSLFNNLYKRLSIINANMKTSTDLAKQIKGNRPSNMDALFNGIKEGFKA
jgi:hypothetical protein